MLKTNTIDLNGFESVVPNEAEAQLAQRSVQHLANLVDNKSEYELQLVGTEDAIAIPASAMQLFAHILGEMAKGNAVTFMPLRAELNIQQATHILNVSRPFLMQLLENEDILAVKIGMQYRIQFQHLMDYKQRIDAQRLETLQELVDQAQELDMGY